MPSAVAILAHTKIRVMVLEIGFHETTRRVIEFPSILFLIIAAIEALGGGSLIDLTIIDPFGVVGRAVAPVLIDCLEERLSDILTGLAPAGLRVPSSAHDLELYLFLGVIKLLIDAIWKMGQSISVFSFSKGN